MGVREWLWLPGSCNKYNNFVFLVINESSARFIARIYRRKIEQINMTITSQNGRGRAIHFVVYQATKNLDVPPVGL